MPLKLPGYTLQGRSQWGGEWRQSVCHTHTHKHTHTHTHTHTIFNFRTKQGPTNSVSNIRGIAFYWCSEIIGTRNITIFTVCAVIFRQFTAAFNFFKLRRGNRSLHVGPSEKVRYLNARPPEKFVIV